MSNYNQFLIKEALSSSQLNRLPNCLHFNFNVSQPNYEMLLLRILTGTVDIEHKLSGKIIKTRTNYCDYNLAKNSRLSATTLLKIFKEGTYANEKDIPKIYYEKYYINFHKYGNQLFFKNLVDELCNYLHKQSLKSHSLAFLHLYRIIELISYTFPLHYTSRAKNYKKTFIQLKSYFNSLDKSDGELAFLKNFINNHLLEGQSILDIELDIHISTSDITLQKIYFENLKKICDDNNFLKNSVPNSIITISRRNLISLLIIIRNRYFHLLTGGYQNNFDSTVLPESDLYFEIVNDIGLTWVAQIYLEIVLTNMEELIEHS